MRTVRLGRTGVEVAAVSLGTWAYGGTAFHTGQPVGWSGHDDETARGALEKAHALGIRHWDTADVYGNGRAEQLIASVWDRVPRDDIFLATKVGWDPGTHSHFYHPDQIRQQMDRSLKNLATDVIDLYYLHHCNFGPDDQYLDDAVAVVREFRSQGKIRYIGLSDWSSEKVARLVESVDPDVVQVYRNVADDTFAASGLQEWVQGADAGAVFFSPIKHGLLLGKYEQPVQFPEGDVRNRVGGFRQARVIETMKRNRRALEERFAGHPEPVLHGLLGTLAADGGCVLLGQRSAEQVQAAARIVEPPSEIDAAWVRDLYAGQAGSVD